MSAQPSRLDIVPDSERSITIAGAIDSHTAPDLLAYLDELGDNGDIRIDLAGVEFIDSSGLRTLVTTHQKLDSAGNQLQLKGISDAVDRLFEITGLRDHLNIS